jgi:hypothetical protein
MEQTRDLWCDKPRSRFITLLNHLSLHLLTNNTFLDGPQKTGKIFLLQPLVVFSCVVAFLGVGENGIKFARLMIHSLPKWSLSFFADELRLLTHSHSSPLVVALYNENL